MSNYIHRSGQQPGSPTSLRYRFSANAPTISFDELTDAAAVRPHSVFAFPPEINSGLPAQSSSNICNEPSEKLQDPLSSACLGIADLMSKILITHPCNVLRRQCQVHQFASSLHLTPFTLIPIVYKVVGHEGLSTLWKGAVGSGVLWGLSAATEILFADLFGLPRNYVKNGKFKKYCQHIALKTCTSLAMTPFIVSSFIETVRSEYGLGGDELRVMDVITNGIMRLRFDFIGSKDNSKRFQLIYLSLPTALLHTLHYVIAINLHDWIMGLAKRYVNRKAPNERNLFHNYLPQMFATLTSQMLADLVCFPLETVLHRLYIQGTRTLIDNLDNGVTAISITGKYVGFFDCVNTMIHRESFWALYAGAGALGLQYIFHMCLLRFIRSMFDYGTRAISGNRQQIPSTTGTSPYRISPLSLDPPLSSNQPIISSLPLK